MTKPRLILVLGDQLTANRGALRDAVPGRDVILMAEVHSEATYVVHNKHKIALIFSAMRHFRDALRDRGFEIIYFEYTDGLPSLEAAVREALNQCDVASVRCVEPGEHRLLSSLRQWQFTVPLELIADDRFMSTREAFDTWARGRKQLRMEYFYRAMRKQHQLLMNADDTPAGGQWNFDAENRRGWRARDALPERPQPEIDAITTEVLSLVEREFPDNPGDLQRFYLAVTEKDAARLFQWFVEHALPHFGTYQDALAEESSWLFHSLISMYLNIGLLDAETCCRQVEQAWRDGHCELAAAEGFIRQILGWREFVRGIYWLTAPDYAHKNELAATRPLPPWFWDGDTDMRCLQTALVQTLDLGYAHHIQRLMVIGNFALLAGLDVKAVCEWYLAVYVDAFEWVELPNTLGMALHADGGLMASKPYAASGKYIQRQGNHCKQCRYNPRETTGARACPYNSLYWAFLDRHEERFARNPRMQLALRNWQRKPDDERKVIRGYAEQLLATIAPE
ncbi:MAG: cryptochrome/photolyase family protein [Halioglobus sp.]